MRKAVHLAYRRSMVLPWWVAGVFLHHKARGLQMTLVVGVNPSELSKFLSWAINTLSTIVHLCINTCVNLQCIFHISVPDNIVLSILSARLSQLDCVSRGWVLHGYPRTREQAETLTKDGFVPNRYLYCAMNLTHNVQAYASII